MPQLLVKQTIGGMEMERKCNASLLVYTNGSIIMQKNIKDSPQWASVGGKVEQSDKNAVDVFLARAKAAKAAHTPIKLEDLTDLDDKVLFTITEQFNDPISATFALAALREASEEIGGNTDFLKNAIVAQKAALIRIDRDNFGIPELNKKFWTEAFYLDFGNMAADELIKNLSASGEADCKEIVIAPIKELEITHMDDTTVTTFKGVPVRHTVGVIATRLQALRDRLTETIDIDCNTLFDEEFTANDPLLKTDLKAELLRFYLPKGKEDKLENWTVILGKNSAGQLKLSNGGMVNHVHDNAFCETVARIADLELFSELPVTNDTVCFAFGLNFKTPSSNSNTDGTLEYAFAATETDFTEQEINDAVATMNSIAPSYYALNELFTTLSEVNPNQLVDYSDEAQELINLSLTLPKGYSFSKEIMTVLDDLVIGDCALQGAGFSKFALEHIHTYAQHNYFVQVPYLQYRDAVASNQPICCLTPTGESEEVSLSAREIDAVKLFLAKFEAERALQVQNTNALVPTLAAYKAHMCKTGHLLFTLAILAGAVAYVANNQKAGLSPNLNI